MGTRSSVTGTSYQPLWSHVHRPYGAYVGKSWICDSGVSILLGILDVVAVLDPMGWVSIVLGLVVLVSVVCRMWIKCP